MHLHPIGLEAGLELGLPDTVETRMKPDTVDRGDIATHCPRPKGRGTTAGTAGV